MPLLNKLLALLESSDVISSVANSGGASTLLSYIETVGLGDKLVGAAEGGEGGVRTAIDKLDVSFSSFEIHLLLINRELAS